MQVDIMFVLFLWLRTFKRTNADLQLKIYNYLVFVSPSSNG